MSAAQADIVWDKDLVPAELLDVLLQAPGFSHVQLSRHLFHPVQRHAQTVR